MTEFWELPARRNTTILVNTDRVDSVDYHHGDDTATIWLGENFIKAHGRDLRKYGLLGGLRQDELEPSK